MQKGPLQQKMDELEIEWIGILTKGLRGLALRAQAEKSFEDYSEKIDSLYTEKMQQAQPIQDVIEYMIQVYADNYDDKNKKFRPFDIEKYSHINDGENYKKMMDAFEDVLYEHPDYLRQAKEMFKPKLELDKQGQERLSEIEKAGAFPLTKENYDFLQTHTHSNQISWEEFPEFVNKISDFIPNKVDKQVYKKLAVYMKEDENFVEKFRKHEEIKEIYDTKTGKHLKDVTITVEPVSAFQYINDAVTDMASKDLKLKKTLSTELQKLTSALTANKEEKNGLLGVSHIQLGKEFSRYTIEKQRTIEEQASLVTLAEKLNKLSKEEFAKDKDYEYTVHGIVMRAKDVFKEDRVEKDLNTNISYSKDVELAKEENYKINKQKEKDQLNIETIKYYNSKILPPQTNKDGTETEPGTLYKEYEEKKEAVENQRKESLKSTVDDRGNVDKEEVERINSRCDNEIAKLNKEFEHHKEMLKSLTSGYIEETPDKILYIDLNNPKVLKQADAYLTKNLAADKIDYLIEECDKLPKALEPDKRKTYIMDQAKENHKYQKLKREKAEKTREVKTSGKDISDSFGRKE